MVRIAVTGGNGQLGRELRGLAAERYAGWEWAFTDIDEMDIGDEGQIAAFFAGFRPDAVVNCAAYTNVDAAEKDPRTAFAVNAEAPRMLAAAAKNAGAALIHISTDFVFGNRKREPYTEDDAPDPLGVYGETKLAGEHAVLNSGCAGAVIRTSWLYSPYGRNFVKSILGAASGNREIRVVSDQWGNPTAADGLAAAIVRMIPRLTSEPAGAGLYHYCDTGVVNRSGFAEEIIRQAGMDCRVVPVPSSEYPMAAVRPEYSALDTGRITRDFGIVPRRWQDALAGVLPRIDNIQ